MCFVWLSEQTITSALHIINRLVFITEVDSVYCEVHTESLYNKDTFRPQNVKHVYHTHLEICAERLENLLSTST
jgi:hypothetical protein